VSEIQASVAAVLLKRRVKYKSVTFFVTSSILRVFIAIFINMLQAYSIPALVPKIIKDLGFFLSPFFMPKILHVVLTLQLKINTHKATATPARFQVQKNPVLPTFNFTKLLSVLRVNSLIFIHSRIWISFSGFGAREPMDFL
jgi:hypothetical protein